METGGGFRRGGIGKNAEIARGEFFFFSFFCHWFIRGDLAQVP